MWESHKRVYIDITNICITKCMKHYHNVWTVNINKYTSGFILLMSIKNFIINAGTQDVQITILINLFSI